MKRPPAEGGDGATQSRHPGTAPEGSSAMPGAQAFSAPSVRGQCLSGGAAGIAGEVVLTVSGISISRISILGEVMIGISISLQRV